MSLKEIRENPRRQLNPHLQDSQTRSCGKWRAGLRPDSRKHEQVSHQVIQVPLREFERRHDTARGELGRVGEMVFDPTTAAALGEPVQRRTHVHTHTIDFMACVAAMRLVDQRALNREIRGVESAVAFCGLSFSRKAASEFSCESLS